MPVAVLSDIASDLGLLRTVADIGFIESLGADERKIYNSVRSCGEVTTDQLCVKTGMAVNKICGIVTVLEMKGLVETALGRVFIAK